RAIGGVLDARDVSPLIHVAHHPEEEHGSAIRAPTHPAENRGHIDWLLDDRGVHHHPPATGGMSATSSPGRSSRSRDAYCSFTATIGAGGSRVGSPISRTC